MRYTEEVVGTLPNLRGFKGWHPRPGGQAYLMSTRAFTEVAESLGVVHGDKHNLDIIEREGSEFYENYLCGLFDADGTVGGCRKKGVSVRLSQSNLPFLQGIQRMLGRLGINSTLYADRHAEGFTLMPDGKGGSAMYPVKATHDLCIANDNLQIFASRIGFKRTHKAKRLEELLSGYKRTPNHDVFLTEVASVVEEGVEDVYDVSVPGVMAFDANGLYVHNCGEAVLPPYGVCLLGSVNLTAHLTDEFVGGSFEIDMPRLRDTVTKAVRFLDNVIDVSGYPLKQQWVEAMVKRRLGIGFTGLADALIAMKLRYGSQEAVQTTEYIVKEMTCAAYRASIDLAKERGPFEMFQRDRHLESNFVKRLPDDILDGIAGHGIRNSHLMSVAPTGTISLFAGNVSSGIEPVFSWKYTRNIRTGVGDETRPHDVVDWAYARHIERGGDPDRLPEWFVTADALTPKEHLETMAAAQKWVDQAISKTVNVPADIPYEDFKDIYRRAYSLGLKGCTVYRPNPNLKSVLEKPKEPEQPDTAHPRTMALHARPECLTGLTYKVKTPLSPDAFYVTMNDMVDADGLARPYEMFINTKNLQHLSWIIAMTRLISAVFRREADASFLIEELKSIHDPQGGYFSGGEYVPSLPAEMGRVIERHMKAIGLIPDGETVEVEKVDALPEGVVRSPGPLCPKCGQPSLVMIENCPRCTKCGYSKCG
jgi:ribonucleoside-diphosphate reductase alpha chain